MNWTTSRWVHLFSVLALCFSMGCSSKGPTRLCDNFQSYQTVEDVRADINRRGLSAEWTERSEGTSPTDKRSAYKFTFLSGPIELLGVEGQMTLTFYNGRLMESKFCPQKGDDFVTALTRNGSKIPQKSGEEIVTNRLTKFRFNTQPNGTLCFTWYDPVLQGEWLTWVASYS